jgi:hypothetical protein
VRVSADSVSERCHDSLRDVNTTEITCPSDNWKELMEIHHNKDNDLFQLHSINNLSQPVHSYCLSSYDSTKLLSSQFYFHSLCWPMIYVLVIYVFSCRANPNAQTTNSLEIISPILHPPTRPAACHSLNCQHLPVACLLPSFSHTPDPSHFTLTSPKQTSLAKSILVFERLISSISFSAAIEYHARS